jgi:hypothetical protein
MLLWEAFFKRPELAGARVRFHLLKECAAGAAGGEIVFDLGFPFRLVALGHPGRQRGLLVFRQFFDCVLDLSEVHSLSYSRARHRCQERLVDACKDKLFLVV